MISVKKTRVLEPSVLQVDNASSIGEKNRAIKHHESSGPGPIKYKVYKKTEVKNRLRDLFHGKCAYCESEIESISHAHIEHWRPKGKVNEDSVHKGYYWLASEWTNLLWACPICNSQANKGNYFPLKAGSTYAYKSTDKLRTERPLLINPCDINPEPHFLYTRFGAISGRSDEGRKSIEVYGLNRSLLVGKRLERAQNVLDRLETIDLLIRNNNALLLSGLDHKAPICKENKDCIDEHLKMLELFLEPKADYLGMSRYLIHEYRKKKKSDKIFMSITKRLKKCGY